MARGSAEPKKEDMLTIVGILAGSFAVLMLLVWFAARAKIVAFWAPKLYVLSRMYLWLPGDAGVPIVRSLHEAGVGFLQRPAKVGLFEWLGYWNATTRPLVLLLTLALAGWVAWVMVRAKPEVRRQYSKAPQRLAQHLSYVFTGTAPILHLRKALSQNKEPFWRRQQFPHELLMTTKVNGRPLIVDGEFRADRVHEALMGIQMHEVDGVRRPKLVGGRMVSETLGPQVVDLMADRQKRPCFPERFSSTGKVIYALLCAHAFGGDQGKEDYAKARDQLNNSARGAAHGFANLTVAQWIFDKYKSHPKAAMLFAVHHWEATYLYELLIQAKRQGKCGHWEFLWLKPMNRPLFYALNTVGRFTPHAESAAAFAQYQFERRCGRMGYVPVKLNEATGAYQHVIFVAKAVRGLELEWERWQDGEDDDEQWWADEEVWKRLSGLKLMPPTAPPPEGIAGETAFDSAMASAEAAAQKKREEEQAANLAAFRAEAGAPDLQW